MKLKTWTLVPDSLSGEIDVCAYEDAEERIMSQDKVLKDAKKLIVKLAFAGEYISTEEVGEVLMNIDREEMKNEL